jgi:integrase
MANGRLTPVLINKARAGQAAPGKYSDGQNGLRLAVARSGAASWVMRFMHNSRRHDHGLGSLQWIGLSKARELAAAKLSALKVDKIDPLGERREGRMSDLRFGKAAEDFIEANKAGWKDPRAVDTWTNSLRDHAGALFPKRVCEITTDNVYGVLAPVWATLNPTAVRLRGRIEAVLAWAKVKGHRDGANPAAWKDNLAAMLPKPKAVKRTVKHHKAVPFADLPVVYSRLAASDDPIAVTIRFCLLTASRPSEAMGARWREIDFKAATWTVPPERMKKDKLHVVPLSHEALDLLRRLPGGAALGRRPGIRAELGQRLVARAARLR